MRSYCSPPNTSNVNIHAIRVSAVAYAKAACKHVDYVRACRAEVLNTHGRVLKALKVGDHVKIFVPPSHSEAVRRRHKAKHICQWRGPLRIESKLSNTTFELSSFFNLPRCFDDTCLIFDVGVGLCLLLVQTMMGFCPLCWTLRLGNSHSCVMPPLLVYYTLLKLLVLMTIP